MYHWLDYTSKSGKVRIYEGASAIYFEHVATGREACMGDGVDMLHTPTGRAMRLGTKAFCKAAAAWLDSSEDELLEAYLPMQKNFLSDFLAKYDGQVQYYAWPGGYEIFYITEDGEVLCAKCVEENLERILGQHRGNDTWHEQEWTIVGIETTADYDDPCEGGVTCSHCNKVIIESSETDCAPADE